MEATKISLMLLLIAWCSGCTTVEISDHEGVVTIERSFGFASINIGSDKNAVTAKITGLGYASTPMGQSFGYTSQSMLVTDSSCKVVVWLNKPPSTEDISMLKKAGLACVFK